MRVLSYALPRHTTRTFALLFIDVHSNALNLAVRLLQPIALGVLLGSEAQNLFEQQLIAGDALHRHNQVRHEIQTAVFLARFGQK